MINFIRGVAENFRENTILIENNGIGYKVYATSKVLNFVDITREEVKIYTYMNVKEDEISLFGFFDISELNLFEKLISVSGVGPKSAISLLNCMEPSEIALAIITSDIKILSKGQGIGKKTAERIALELKDKIDTFDALNKIENISENTENDKDKLETIEALIVLGFSRSEVVKVVSSIQENISVDKMISIALKSLSK